jgi:hypothetical protein
MTRAAEILDEFALPSDPFVDQGNLQSNCAQVGRGMPHGTISTQKYADNPG